MLDELEGRSDCQQAPPPARKKMRTPKDEQLRAKFFRIFGTDLTAIPSVNVGTVEVLLGEVGPDLRRFRSAGAFANWLGLCPNETITGGKVLASAKSGSRGTRAHQGVCPHKR
jgi:transposase